MPRKLIDFPHKLIDFPRELIQSHLIWKEGEMGVAVSPVRASSRSKIVEEVACQIVALYGRTDIV